MRAHRPPTPGCAGLVLLLSREEVPAPRGRGDLGTARPRRPPPRSRSSSPSFRGVRDSAGLSASGSASPKHGEGRLFAAYDDNYAALGLPSRIPLGDGNASRHLLATVHQLYEHLQLEIRTNAMLRNELSACQAQASASATLLRRACLGTKISSENCAGGTEKGAGESDSHATKTDSRSGAGYFCRRVLRSTTATISGVPVVLDVHVSGTLKQDMQVGVTNAAGSTSGLDAKAAKTEIEYKEESDPTLKRPPRL